MSLCFCTRSESDTRNAVTSHDCYTVSRECPFVCKRTSFSHAFCLSISETLFAVQSFICFFQSLCYFVIFRDYPCREVALDRIYKVCIGRTVVFIHGYCYVVAIFLYSRKSTDLIQAAFPCFACCHTTVKRYRAGVSYCTAAWGCEEDFGSSNSATSKETCFFPFRVVFLIKHFYKTFDLCGISSIVFV